MPRNHFSENNLSKPPLSNNSNFKNYEHKNNHFENTSKEISLYYFNIVWQGILDINWIVRVIMNKHLN